MSVTHLTDAALVPLATSKRPELEYWFDHAQVVYFIEQQASGGAHTYIEAVIYPATSSPLTLQFKMPTAVDPDPATSIGVVHLDPPLSEDDSITYHEQPDVTDGALLKTAWSVCKAFWRGLARFIGGPEGPLAAHPKPRVYCPCPRRIMVGAIGRHEQEIGAAADGLASWFYCITCNAPNRSSKCGCAPADGSEDDIWRICAFCHCRVRVYQNRAF